MAGPLGNTFIYSYQYIDMRVKWLAAVKLLEPGECFQKVDVKMIYPVNLLFQFVYSKWLDKG